MTVFYKKYNYICPKNPDRAEKVNHFSLCLLFHSNEFKQTKGVRLVGSFISEQYNWRGTAEKNLFTSSLYEKSKC